MENLNGNNIKRVLAINDLSCFGKCSLTVSIPIISHFGVEVVPLPTALLSNHTGGFKDYYCLELGGAMQSIMDKWAALDGSLGGALDGIYEVPLNSNIFSAINGLLLDDQGNGLPFDDTPAIYTSYYNNMTQTLPDGTTASLIETPYTARFDSFGKTYADVILELNDMLAGWIGYDATGALRLDPSQDDILDISKPVSIIVVDTRTSMSPLIKSYIICSSFRSLICP